MLNERYQPGVLLEDQGFLASQHNQVFDAVARLNAKYSLLPNGDVEGVGPAGGSLTPVVVYENLTGGSSDEAGKITLGEITRCLPVVADGGGWKPNLDAEFLELPVWALASLDLSGTGGCGETSTPTPTGPRISLPTGEGSINRFATIDAADAVLSGTGAVPGETLTLTLQGINETTGAVGGAVVTWTNAGGATTLVNNGGSWDTTPQSLATLDRGLCLAKITNGSTSHYALVLNSANEWEPGESNLTGDIYWTGKADNPTSADILGGVTEDLTPSFRVTLSGTEFIGLKDDIAPLVYLINQATGAVTVLAGAAGDYSSVSYKVLTPGANLALSKYTAQAVNYLAFDNGSYLNAWHSPPSNPFSFQVVADASAVDTSRWSRLGIMGTLEGIGPAIVGIDKCRRAVPAAEITKLDA